MTDPDHEYRLRDQCGTGAVVATVERMIGDIRDTDLRGSTDRPDTNNDVDTSDARRGTIVLASAGA